MRDRRNSPLDRRTGNDRRRVYNLDYLLKGGIERRRRSDRRSYFDRRAGWMRVSRWHSICQSMILNARNHWRI